jgi:hypothetical protein
MPAQQFIGTTKTYKAVETLGGTPSSSPLPCLWTTDSPARVQLAPVNPDSSGASLECNVTAASGFGPASVNITATVPNGPAGTLQIDLALPVDQVVIQQE